jgi:hypothetical protein
VNPSKPDDPLLLQHHDVHGNVVYRSVFGKRQG